jgi:hypothetical protein
LCVNSLLVFYFTYSWIQQIKRFQLSAFSVTLQLSSNLTLRANRRTLTDLLLFEGQTIR